jgi:hypothetical protein
MLEAPHYQRYPLVIPWNGALSYAIRIDVISAIA